MIIKRLSFLFFIILFFGTSPCFAQKDQGNNLFQDVIANAQKCSKWKTGSEFVKCYTDASPKKCEKEIIDALVTKGESKSMVRRKLYMCISTCVDASFYSRNFGECYRKL